VRGVANDALSCAASAKHMHPRVYVCCLFTQRVVFERRGGYARATNASTKRCARGKRVRYSVEENVQARRVRVRDLRVSAQFTFRTRCARRVARSENRHVEEAIYELHDVDVSKTFDMSSRTRAAKSARARFKIVMRIARNGMSLAQTLRRHAMRTAPASRTQERKTHETAKQQTATQNNTQPRNLHPPTRRNGVTNGTGRAW